MKTRILIGVVLVPALLLAACAPKAVATPKEGTVATAIPPALKATAVPTKKAQTAPTKIPGVAPTHEATPTPGASTSSKPSTSSTSVAALIDSIAVHDQEIQSGHILVSMVDARQAGWLAIFTDDKGQPGTLLGYTAIPAGTSNDVEVPIDVQKATDKMIAMLLSDEGKVGDFEYPGPDTPIVNANINGNVMAVFSRLSAAPQ